MSGIIPLLVDVDAGMATFGFTAMMDLAERVGAISVTVDDQHGLTMLCRHPRTGVVDFHDVCDLLDDTPQKPTLAAV